MKANFITIKVANIYNNHRKILLGIASLVIAFFSSLYGSQQYLQHIDVHITFIILSLAFVYVLFSSLKINMFSCIENKTTEDIEEIDAQTKIMLCRFKSLLKLFFITFLVSLFKYMGYDEDDSNFDDIIVIIENTWLIYALTYSVFAAANQAYGYLYYKIEVFKRESRKNE